MISPRHPFPSGRRPAPPSASPAAITRPTAVMSPHVQWPGIAAGTPGALSPAVTPAAPLRPRATGQAMSLFPHALTARTAGDAGVFVVVVVVVVTPFTRTRLKPAPAARATGARRLSAIRAIPADSIAPRGRSPAAPRRLSAIRAIPAGSVAPRGRSLAARDDFPPFAQFPQALSRRPDGRWGPGAVQEEFPPFAQCPRRRRPARQSGRPLSPCARQFPQPAAGRPSPCYCDQNEFPQFPLPACLTRGGRFGAEPGRRGGVCDVSGVCVTIHAGVWFAPMRTAPAARQERNSGNRGRLRKTPEDR